jgi:hypothetical protein
VPISWYPVPGPERTFTKAVVLYVPAAKLGAAPEMVMVIARHAADAVMTSQRVTVRLLRFDLGM